MNIFRNSAAKQAAIQRAYYARTACQYDNQHVFADHEHNFALKFMLSSVKDRDISSVLDIGSGTGRALLEVKNQMPAVSAVGIEPSAELRKVGFAKGLLETELIDGDATNLEFGDDSFDLVCEFGALHHISTPSRAVSEMLRVSRKIIFISDCNNFGIGSGPARLVKQAINSLGLWGAFNLLKTGLKGYTLSDGDGLAYSYSVFNDYDLIRSRCRSVHLLNTTNAGRNLYRTASHVALLGIK